MWTCGYCGAENSVGIYCTSCGKKHESAPAVERPVKIAGPGEQNMTGKETPPHGWTCLVCGTTNAIGYAFCENCGAVKGSAAPEPRRENNKEKTARPVRSGTQERTKRSKDTLLNVVLGVLICGVIALVILLISVLSGNRSGRAEENTAETRSGTAVNEVTEPASPVTSGIPAATVPPSPAATPVPTATPEPTATPVPEYLLPDSNTRYLTNADLSGLSHEQLCLARNEIFARHGYIFKTKEIAAYFEGKSWYQGTVAANQFDSSVLNSYENANIKLIQSYEKQYYGGSYY